MTKYRGADYPINKTLTTDGSTPIVITNLKALIIYIVHKYSNVIISQYQYPAAAGYKAIEVVDDAAGKIRFRFQSAESTMAKTGLLSIEYLIRETDVDYDDNEYDQVVIENYDFLIDDVIKAE